MTDKKKCPIRWAHVHESVNRKLMESACNSKRLCEGFPPIINNFNKYEKDSLRNFLSRKGVDIENTPYTLEEITSARDPRLKKGLLIVEFDRNHVAALYDGSVVVNTYLPGTGTMKSVSNSSWKDIIAASSAMYTMQFDQTTSDAMKQKQLARASAKKGSIKRYTSETRPRYGKMDKSGYLIDPNKYKKMLADAGISNGPQILQKAKDVYVQLSSKLDQYMSADAPSGGSTFESYEYIVRSIPSQFQILSRYLKEYNENKAKYAGEDLEDFFKAPARQAVQELQELIRKAQKYLD